MKNLLKIGHSYGPSVPALSFGQMRIFEDWTFVWSASVPVLSFRQTKNCSRLDVRTRCPLTDEKSGRSYGPSVPASSFGQMKNHLSRIGCSYGPSVPGVVVQTDEKSFEDWTYTHRYTDLRAVVS